MQFNPTSYWSKLLHVWSILFLSASDKKVIKLWDWRINRKLLLKLTPVMDEPTRPSESELTDDIETPEQIYSPLSSPGRK